MGIVGKAVGEIVKGAALPYVIDGAIKAVDATQKAVEGVSNLMTNIALRIATAARIIRPAAAAAHLLEAVVEAKAQVRLHRLRHLPRLRLPPRNPLRKRLAPALRRMAIPSRVICFTTNTATSSLSPLRRATAKPSIW